MVQNSVSLIVMPVILKKEAEIFWVSFLILFLELSFIRLFPGQITLLGFYTNFILIASFTGIGLGFLLSKYSFDLRKVFPWAFLFVCIFLSVFKITVTPNSDGEIALEKSFGVVPEFIAIPLIFLLVSVLFAMLSQRLGVLFDKTKPLVAYKWDILGSISGVVSLLALSYLRTSPTTWLIIFSAVFLYAQNVRGKSLFKNATILGVSILILFFGIYKEAEITRWSPYQKLSLITSDTGYNLIANGIPHQFVTNDFKLIEPFYHFPYQVLERNDFKEALVIGSGMGTDVAVALSYGVHKIDAVDIEPEIYRLGKEFNPAKPYDNPNVSFYNDDARAFLSKTKKTYDLIIFALPDSMVLAASRGNIRLEGFLFTEESFKLAKDHLNTDGLIVLYNYYRQPFIVDRLTLMLNKEFAKDSLVLKGGPPFYPAAILNGGAIDQARKDIEFANLPTLSPVPATDDWPFLYMQKPHIPGRYLLVLFLILVSVYFLVSKVVKKPLVKFLKFNYFFLGVGFFLIETKSIVQFSLLFGATWITSSLVIIAILISVYLATNIAFNKKIVSIKPLYFGLFLALFIQYLFPLDSLLAINTILRYLIVSVITFAPIFFANIIFSYTFKSSKENSINFASNMFGAVVGGALEYLALIIGYQHLVVVIAVCYFLAFATPSTKEKGRSGNPF